MEGGREKSTAVPRMFLRAVYQRLAGTPATQYKMWSLINLEKVLQQVGWGISVTGVSNAMAGGADLILQGNSFLQTARRGVILCRGSLLLDFLPLKKKVKKSLKMPKSQISGLCPPIENVFFYKKKFPQFLYIENH